MQHLPLNGSQMYRVHCPALGAEVSLSSDAILSLHKVSTGTTGYFRCACGATGVLTVGPLEITPVLHHPTRTGGPERRELVGAGTKVSTAA